MFADASTKAYGAVAYVQNSTRVDLIMEKSHVLPLRDITLPRLELKGTVIAANFAKLSLQPYSRL